MAGILPDVLSPVLSDLQSSGWKLRALAQPVDESGALLHNTMFQAFASWQSKAAQDASTTISTLVSDLTLTENTLTTLSQTLLNFAKDFQQAQDAHALAIQGLAEIEHLVTMNLDGGANVSGDLADIGRQRGVLRQRYVDTTQALANKAAAVITQLAETAPKHPWHSANVNMASGLQVPGANSLGGGATMLGDIPVFGSLFGPNGPGSTDMQQGPGGDCWLLATAATMANNNPQALRNIIKDNGDGTYSVTLFINGKSQTVIVDSVTPEDVQNGQIYQDSERDAQGDLTKNNPQEPNLTSITAASAPLWPAILERAYAIADGNNYSNLNSNQPAVAFQALTGQQAQEVAANNLSSDDLANAVNSPNGATAAALFPASGPSADLAQHLNLIGDHNYYIKSYDSSTGMIQLGNPWGPGYTPKPMTLDQFHQLFQYIAYVPS